MTPRELCEKAWQEIASHFPDFKVVAKGQKLKKIAKNKDIVFEIYFQANRHNFDRCVEFIPHISITSKAMKSENINNGFVYGGELGALIGRSPWKWWQLGGASYKYTVEEVTALLKKHIIPLFEDFEDTASNIDGIINKKSINHDLFFYVWFFGEKNEATQYFNRIMKEDKLKNKYIAFYQSLKDVPKESIDLSVSEFSGALWIKFAYLNGIEIEKKCDESFE